MSYIEEMNQNLSPETIAKINADFKKLQDKIIGKENTLVLDHFNVVQLVGVVNEPDDYYWVYQPMRGEKYYSSCCGGWTPLKDNISDEDYKYLVSVWNLNISQHSEGHTELAV